jgi:APA family basic amino acid/polyamine antiporter
MGVGWIFYFVYGIHKSKFNVDPVGRFAEGTKPEFTTENEDGYLYDDYDYTPVTHRDSPASPHK